MYSEKMVMRLNEVAHRYKDLVYQSIFTVINQPPYRNTGAAAASLKVDVVDGDQTKAPRLDIRFDDQLIFIGTKKMEWTKLPNMKKLIAWAETKKATREEAEQLAWAVSWDKKNNDTWKPKQWRKKSLSEVLKEMNELIVKAFDQAIEEDLQQAIKV